MSSTLGGGSMTVELELKVVRKIKTFLEENDITLFFDLEESQIAIERARNILQEYEDVHVNPIMGVCGKFTWAPGDLIFRTEERLPKPPFFATINNYLFHAFPEDFGSVPPLERKIWSSSWSLSEFSYTFPY